MLGFSNLVDELVRNNVNAGLTTEFQHFIWKEITIN